MKLSLVLSTYNGAKYIVEQMDSLRNQTRKIDELLIFDDRSTDSTVEIIQQYIRKNQLDSWKLEINTENLGWRKNFMLGIWKASGDLIFTCDQDDIWMLDKVERMERIMEERPEITVLTSFYYGFFSDGSEKLIGEHCKEEVFLQRTKMNIFGIPYPGCTYCIRRKIAQLSKVYWQEDFPHDALFWRMANFSEGLYTCNIPMIRMRKHSHSAYTMESVKLKSKQSKCIWMDYGVRSVEMLLKYIKDESVPNRQKKEEILRANLDWLKMRIRFYESGNVWLGVRLLKYIRCYPKVRQYLGDWYLLLRREESRKNED